MNKMLKLLVVVLLTQFVLHSESAMAQANPIVGKWQWTRDVNNCTEVYDYREDGHLYVVSGEEVTENRYEISASPDRLGFYVVSGRTVKTNGKKDCSDAATTSEVAKPYTMYVIFHRVEPLHLVCYEPKIEKCFGPLRRVLP